VIINIIFADELEELRDIVVCLCKGDYLTALQQKTPQHLLHTAAVTTGEKNMHSFGFFLVVRTCSYTKDYALSLWGSW